MHLMYHPQRNRENTRSRITAVRVGENRFAPFDIDPHAEYRVNEAKTICAGFHTCPRDRSDVRDVRTQFHIYRFGRYCLDSPRHRCCRFGIRSKSHATVMDVRTGDIHLQNRCVRLLINPLTYVRVFVDAESADIRNDRSLVDGAQGRHLMADDFLHTGVLQPDGIQHACAATLCDTR